MFSFFEALRSHHQPAILPYTTYFLTNIFLAISRTASIQTQNEFGEDGELSLVDDFNVEMNPYYCEDRLYECCNAHELYSLQTNACFYLLHAFDH